MARYSGPEDVYRELVEESEENWLSGLVAFAIVEEKKIEWMKHHREQYNMQPSPRQICEWYEQQPERELLLAKAMAEGVLSAYSAEVVEDIEVDLRREIEEATIVREIRRYGSFWPQFCVNLVGGLASAVLFTGFLVLIAFFVLNDTSPTELVKTFKANREQVADDKQ